MKNTIRRLAGWLMALMMVFGSVIVPTGSGDRYALAEGDDGIANQLLQTGTEGEGEGEITEPNYVNLKRLYDLYYEALTTAEGLSEEELLPEIVLGEEWAALMPEDQALLRLLISGAWDFVYDDLGALIGVQEHVFEIDIPADAAEQTTPPPAQEDPDPAGEIPEVTFVDGDLVTNPPAANDDAEGGDQVTNPPAANDDAEGGDQVTNPPAANDDAEGGDQVTNPPAANDDAEGGDQVTNPPAVEGGDQVTNPPVAEDAGEEETIPGAAEPTAEGSETYPVAEEGTETLEVEEASEGSGTLDVVDEVIEEIVDPEDDEQELIPENKEEEEVTGGEEIPGGEAAFVGGRMNADEEFAEETKATGLNATRFTVKNAQMLKISQDAGEGNDGEILEADDKADGQAPDGNRDAEQGAGLRMNTTEGYSVEVSPSNPLSYNGETQSFEVTMKSSTRTVDIKSWDSTDDTPPRVSDFALVGGTLTGKVKDAGLYTFTVHDGENGSGHSVDVSIEVVLNTPQPIKYDVTPLTATYDGAGHTPTTITFSAPDTVANDFTPPSAADYTVTYKLKDSSTYESGAPVNAGKYDMKVELTTEGSCKYSIAEAYQVKTGVVTINKAELEDPTIAEGSRTLPYKDDYYTSAELLDRVTFTGFVDGESVPDGTKLRFKIGNTWGDGPIQEAGTYNVTVWLPENCNYIFKNSTDSNHKERRTLQEPNKFTITPAVIDSVTLNPKSPQYVDSKTWTVVKTTTGSTATHEILLTVSAGTLTLPAEGIKITSASTLDGIGNYTIQWELDSQWDKKDNYVSPDSTDELRNLPYILSARPFTATWDVRGNNVVTYNNTDWTSYLKQHLSVVDGLDGTALAENTDYTVTVTASEETATTVKNADDYTVTIAGANGTLYAGTTEDLTFTIKPAVVTGLTLAYSSATYDRSDWAGKVYLNGAASPSGNYPNVITATATKAAGTTGTFETYNLTATEGFVSRSGASFIDANDSYKVGVTVSNNYTYTDGSNVTANTLTFAVKPAVVETSAIKWSSATFDRSDWAEKIYLHGTTAPDKYPIEITAHAKGAAGTINASQEFDLGDAASDFDNLDKPEMISAGDYTIKATVSSNFSADGTAAGGDLSFPFTVVPAMVFTTGTYEPVLAYDNATYNRKDWGEDIYLNAGTGPDNYPNVLMAYAGGVEGTINKDDLDKSPLTLGLPAEGATTDYGYASETALEIKNEMIKAGTYEKNILVTVTDNYQVPEDGYKPGPGGTFALDFTVNPAEIDSAALDYNKTFYDRHDWHGELLTFDKKKDKPADYDNVLTIKTKPVKYGEKVSDEVLTLNEKTEDMAAAADEYEIKDGTMKDAGSYSVEWSLTDTVDFAVEEARKDELQKLPFTVEKAEITSVTIKRDDGDADTSATVVYDGAEWRERIGINDASGEPHFFIVKATTASKTIPGTDFVIGSLTLTNSEYELSYPKRDPNGKIIRIGEYTVQEDLTDTTNFKYSATLDLEGEKTGAKPYVQLPFTVTRYEAEPIRDTTASVVGPSKDSVVKYKSVYHMGPEQSESARILTFTGEPGEEVNVTIGGTTVRTTFSGTKYTNYGGGSTKGDLKLTISSSGVVTIDRTSTTVKLTPNSDTTITLSYADAANLKDGSAEKDPGTLSVKVHFDTIKPQIAAAVDPFLNRDMTVSITVPEAGRLDSISFDETISVEDVDYVSESENYGKFKATLDVPWNTEGAPHLIHSGKEAIEMKYTDLVYNTASAKFDIGQSTGAPIIITIEPIVSADKERIDMDERPEQVKVTVEGTGYELMYLTFEPSKSDQASGTATGTGAWVRESTGEWSTIVETDAFSNDYDITATSWYDDLVGQEVYTFFFDDVADPIILTVPEITEDNWVIPGIAEANSEVRITVDGEKVLTKNDRFTIFTGRKPQLKAGSQVRIVATDLSNNRAEVNLTVQPSPTDGMQTLDAYAMGKVYTDAHTTKEEPKWLMAGLYTEEELTKGVSVPLIAGSAFHIGEVQLKMEGGKLNSVFTPKEGVTLSGQKVTAQIATSRVFNMESFNAGEKKNAENAIGYWISAYVQAKIPVEMLHQTFQLDENQAEIRSFYFNRQRLESMPE